MNADTCLRANIFGDFGRGFAILTWVSFYSRSACRAIQFVVQLLISAQKWVTRLSVLFFVDIPKPRRKFRASSATTM
jgi:hypothetical protein